MPANRFKAFTDYGIGIGLRIAHYEHISEQKPVVAWFEIISENYMVDGGRPLSTPLSSTHTAHCSMFTLSLREPATTASEI
jgi:uncharacterized protein (UPF0276 family)